MPFYAVRKGYNPGVYNTWRECEEQIKGFSEPKYKKFPTKDEAEAFVRGEDAAGPSRPTPARALAANSNVGPEWDVVYSDGACKGNGQVGSVAGVGVWWGPDDPRRVSIYLYFEPSGANFCRNIAERCPGDQTNNRAELIAILRVLETTPMSKKPLLIRSDSKYSMDCVNIWIHNWRKRDWKTAAGGPVKNPGIIRLIDAHLERRKQYGQTVKFEYVKGHSGDVGNDGADTQANEGAKLPEVPERDWTRDLERLQEEQELDIPPDFLDDPGEEVEPPKSALTNVRKRSRSPPRAGASSATAEGTALPQALKSPPRDTAVRFAAIQEALRSPPGKSSSRSDTIDGALKGKASPRVAAIEQALKAPQADAEQPPRKRRAVTPPQNGGPLPRVSPSSSRNTTSSRIADLEAALAGASGPENSGQMPAPGFKLPQRHAPTTATGSNPSPETRYEDFPVRVIYALPPLVPVLKEDINIDDYADCLLSDDELADEIE
ncbi:hypothetical protein NMY22_g8928 [Coprinellus aureogranulatus]|nr:hypothetical protein NMY22_g8928 [Coprinellus aureogranulatus]